MIDKIIMIFGLILNFIGVILLSISLRIESAKGIMAGTKGPDGSTIMHPLAKITYWSQKRFKLGWALLGSGFILQIASLFL